MKKKKKKCGFIKIIILLLKNLHHFGGGKKKKLFGAIEKVYVPYSPTIFKNVLSLILQTFLYLDAFECNTTSDWLNRMV